MWQKRKLAKFDLCLCSVAVTHDRSHGTALFKPAIPKNGIAEKEEVGAGRRDRTGLSRKSPCQMRGLNMKVISEVKV